MLRMSISCESFTGRVILNTRLLYFFVTPRDPLFTGHGRQIFKIDLVFEVSFRPHRIKVGEGDSETCHDERQDDGQRIEWRRHSRRRRRVRQGLVTVAIAGLEIKKGLRVEI